SRSDRSQYALHTLLVFVKHQFSAETSLRCSQSMQVDFVAERSGAQLPAGHRPRFQPPAF
ncbi:MAG TPA: hypothetical protein VF510_13135, partial [Ktedonobacterales bacterium]